MPDQSTLRFQPIESDAQWGPPANRVSVGFDFDTHLDEADKEQIKALLVGRSVVQVHREGESGHLLLDDGTVLKLFGNDGGCACSAGCYELTHLQGVENVITDVTFQDNPGDDSYDGTEEGAYRIFVFAGNEQVNLATFEGSDGNGYYGTGYHILVRRPESSAEGTTDAA